MERLGANAAVQFAMRFWDQLAVAARKDGLRFDTVWGDSNDAPGGPNTKTCQHTKELVFTESAESDHRLHRRFRSNLGPYWNVERIRMSVTHNPLSGEKWVALLLASDGVIPEYNFMTLLRSECLETFWMTETASCDGLLVVPRAQFVFVELARCREGYYDGKFRHALQLFDIKTACDYLEVAVERGDLHACKSALHNLQTQWPYPTLQILKISGAVRVLKFVSALEGSDALIRTTCRDQLQRWHDLIAMGKLNPTLSERQSLALQRVAKALANSSSMNSGSKQQPSHYATKNTANLSDLIVPTPKKERTNGNLFAPSTSGNDDSASTLARVFADYGVAVLPSYCNAEDVATILKQAQQALRQLQDEQLTPRGLVVDGEEFFDFVEVRQRPGHRVDNRYKIFDDRASPIAMLGRKLLADLAAQLFADDESGWKLLYAGVVHSFPRKSKDDPAPPPQLWHRDGPSLFASDQHHPTHCFNVFVPLVDVSAHNGTTEFVTGTHEDRRYNKVAADVIIGKPNLDEAASVRADVPAGTAIAFDIRVLHRGVSNHSDRERPVLYFTFARDWFQEQHMFQKTESLLNSHGGLPLVLYAKLCQELYQIVSAKPPKKYDTAAEYGHPHYTTFFDLLLLEHLSKAASSTTSELTNTMNDDCVAANPVMNVTAVLKFCNMSNDGEKDAVCRELIDTLESDHALERKRIAFEAARQNRRKQHGELEDGQDFASIHTDLSDVAALYQLSAELLFEETALLSKLGFTKDEHGVCIMLALLKSYAEASQSSLIGCARLEECFTSWWHASLGRSRFQLISSRGSDQPVSHRKLLVVFSSLGSGIARPEWRGTLRAIGAFSFQDLDVLCLMDFAFSWYCQDPNCQWNGGQYYEKELSSWTEKYQAVFFLGDSMGAAGALRFSTLADTVLAFTPQVDISSYEALTRTDFTLTRRKQFQDEVITAVCKSKAQITVHYGGQCTEDVRQVQLLPHSNNLHLVEHEYDDHILSLYLRDKGELADIVGNALNIFLFDKN